MRADLLHRRLALLTGLSAILAFAAGAGADAPMIFPCTVALALGLFWQPTESASAWFERVGIVIALALAARAGLAVFQGGPDVVIPVVDLLFLLLAGEGLRPLGHSNDVRLYSLSFALILAATAYHPGIFFAVGFLCFVVLGTLALAVGHVGRESVKRGQIAPPVTRRRLAFASVLSGLVLLSSAFVFLAFPRVSSGWNPRPLGDGMSVAGFGRSVSLTAHGTTIRPNPRVVLRVQFPDGRPSGDPSLHWRGRAYVAFDGETWAAVGTGPTLTATTSIVRRRSGGTVRQDVEAEHVTDRVAFALSTPLGVGGSEGTRVTRRGEDGYQYRSSAFAPSYRAFSVLESPPADSLRLAPRPPAAQLGRYTQLPSLPERIHGLADSLTAGLTNDYDRARAIERWLRTEFEYTLELPATEDETSLEYFLFERREGHCQYFSTAMAVLLRTLGIPTREVTGYLGGQWNELGGFMAVTENEAHAWTEVWFHGWGWVTFDPTPASRYALTQGATGWTWPALAFLDGLSFRWSEWVLNFSGQIQYGFINRLMAGGDDPADSGDGSAGGTGAAAGLPLGRILIAATLILLLFAPRILRFRSRPAFETRAFLRLRRVAASAGIEGAGHIPASALAERIAASVPEAGSKAASVVRTYLDSRFGARPPSPDQREALALDLRQAIATLRRHGSRAGAR